MLIARNNQTGQVGAVTGLNEDGTPKMTADVISAKLSELVKFTKGQNPMEAFLSNFMRQCKNPTTFGFFKVLKQTASTAWAWQWETSSKTLRRMPRCSRTSRWICPNSHRRRSSHNLHSRQHSSPRRFHSRRRSRKGHSRPRDDTPQSAREQN